MRRLASALLSFLLLFAVVCPAFCFTKTSEVKAHACCPEKGDTSGTKPCGQMAPANPTVPPALPVLAAIIHTPPVVFAPSVALVFASLSPRPIAPSPPRQLFVLRI